MHHPDPGWLCMIMHEPHSFCTDDVLQWFDAKHAPKSLNYPLLTLLEKLSCSKHRQAKMPLSKHGCGCPLGPIRRFSNTSFRRRDRIERWTPTVAHAEENHAICNYPPWPFVRPVPFCFLCMFPTFCSPTLAPKFGILHWFILIHNIHPASLGVAVHAASFYEFFEYKVAGVVNQCASWFKYCYLQCVFICFLQNTVIYTHVFAEDGPKRLFFLQCFQYPDIPEPLKTSL